MQTRILIVLEEGKFKAASITDDTGTPIPLDAEGVAAALPDFNAAAIVELQSIRSEHLQALAAKQAEIEAAIEEKQAEITELASEKARAEQAVTQIAQAVKDPKINAESTALVVAEVVEDFTATEHERKKSAIRKQISELQKTLAEIEGKPVRR